MSKVCPPCPPSIDIGSSEFSATIKVYERENREASDGLKSRAANESEFKRSAEYRKDLDQIRTNNRIIGDLRKLDKSMEKNRAD